MVLSEQVRDISPELLWEYDVQVLSGLDISECLVEFIFGHLDVFLYLTLNKLVNFVWLYISNKIWWSIEWPQNLILRVFE